MTQIILDASMRTKLHDLRLPLVLCDESGKALAELIPILDPSDYEATPPPPISPEELNRRRSETDEFTTAEMIGHLENL